jgi:methionyl-tRNA formyltransferase
MKVLIITEEDVFYLHEFFRAFYALAQKAPYTVAGVSVLAAFNKRSYVALARQMYSFYGPFRFVEVGCRYVWRRLTGKTVAGLTKRYGYSLVEGTSINSRDYLDKVKAIDPDVIVSVAAPQLFKKPLIDLARLGCINSHSSLLPENKGMMPVFWAMYKGAPELGVTIHYINEKLDEGDIITQEKMPVGDETLHQMILKTKIISARLIDETLRRFSSEGKLSSKPMPKGGSYQSFPTAIDVREFRRKGKRIL